MAEGGGHGKLVGLVDDCPYDAAVRIALNLKGIPYPYTAIRQDLYIKTEQLQASDPIYKKFPVLSLLSRAYRDEPIITESLSMVLYIDQVWTHEPSILPSDPFHRTVAVVRVAGVAILLENAMKFIEFSPTDEGESKREMFYKHYKGFTELEDEFVKSSKGKAFFGGDNIGYLDIALGTFWKWFLAVEIMANVRLIDETRTPNLCRWAQMFCSHEAVKDVLLEPSKLVEIIQMFRDISQYMEHAKLVELLRICRAGR